jgi:hypothetical protein
MAKNRSAIQEHIAALKALDAQFSRFDAKLRKLIRTNPDLKRLEADLDRTLDCVRLPAYGMRGSTRRRGGRRGR